jgi:outer membrane protein insertion porin family
MKRIFIAIIFLISTVAVTAQPRFQSGGGAQDDEPGYLNPKDYVIGGVSISGTKYLDTTILVQITKLRAGSTIVVPGEATSGAVKNLWEQGLFDDVQLHIRSIREDTIFFNISVVERPRLSRINIIGLKKGQSDELREKLKDKTGKIVNENLTTTTTAIIKRYFNDKGFLNAEVSLSERKDDLQDNNVILDVAVDRKNKVKVQTLTFEGNKEFKTSQLRKYMKKTHQRSWYKLFGSGKFYRDKYEADKEKLIAKMQEKGYRDAEIISDTVTAHNSKTVDVHINVHEGPKYYFGNIVFAGNAKYNEHDLKRILAIDKGEVFSEEKLEKKIHGPSNSGSDLSSLYLNDGYLTFSADPVQTKIYSDTIDLEIRIFEGQQFTINKVIVKGNDITNDKVVRREIRTIPGEKFNKEQVIRSQRAIVALGNFDEQKMDIKPMPNNDGTVDIQYTVTEKPSDQVELSGGFGGGRIIGTLGLTFNNFSARNLFNLKEWRPLPKGDGQKLSIRGQTNGKSYRSYSFSFSEPWLGGKKPVYFGISAFTSLSSNSDFADYYGYTADQLYRIRLNGVTFSLGERVKWPDDNFQVTYSLNLQQYKLENYPGFLFSNGTSYNLNLSQEITRNTVDAPIYPTSGSNLRFTVQLTPPYSLMNKINYATAPDREKYRFTEYHKWKFEAQWFQAITSNRKLVLKAQTQFGFLGQYNKSVGQSAFERFKLGGDGMQGFDYLQGSEVIAMRGYSNNAVIPVGANQTIAQASGSPIFNKTVLEIRYPITTGQSATMFLLGFAEGGNTWNRFKDFSPFNVRRAVGLGARVFLPIFGMLGIDYGFAFDKIPGLPDNGRQKFTFSIAQQMGGFN